MTTVFLTHLSANKHMNKYHSQIVVTIHSRTTTNRNESDKVTVKPQIVTWQRCRKCVRKLNANRSLQVYCT